MSFAKNENIIETLLDKDKDTKRAFQAAEHFNPAYDRILIKREMSALERKTQKSGIILADQTKDAYQSAEGFLIKCGPTASKEAQSLVGKRILFSKYTGDDIIIPLPDGTKEQFILATDRDIYGELK